MNGVSKLTRPASLLVRPSVSPYRCACAGRCGSSGAEDSLLGRGGVLSGSSGESEASLALRGRRVLIAGGKSECAIAGVVSCPCVRVASKSVSSMDGDVMCCRRVGVVDRSGISGFQVCSFVQSNVLCSFLTTSQAGRASPTTPREKHAARRMSPTDTSASCAAPSLHWCSLRWRERTVGTIPL
jgi:hypothetical protein